MAEQNFREKLGKIEMELFIKELVNGFWNELIFGDISTDLQLTFSKFSLASHFICQYTYKSVYLYINRSILFF